ncbi:MAG: hypothetical protein KatS3mg015_2501 [Fimbriimonadales bacterium]|nr:MAG: hypothetical protein KatS3mg015_2501 [Fimbriimonadales bacterium]
MSTRSITRGASFDPRRAAVERERERERERKRAYARMLDEIEQCYRERYGSRRRSR